MTSLHSTSTSTNTNAENALNGPKDNKNTSKGGKAKKDNSNLPKKQHTMTVCMSIPESESRCWELVSKARRQLKDPGYFRWPPHANLLYPFIDVVKTSNHSKNNTNDVETEGEDLIDSDILQRLRNATRQMEPFTVSLNRLGTFGGARRGVLWLYPYSFREGDEGSAMLVEGANSNNAQEPLVKLQSYLQDQFPFCSDQQKVAGQFHPHMTVSHFVNLEDALKGKADIETWWPQSPPVQFLLDEIYLLQRKGDDGQFIRVASIPLGDNDREVTIHNPPGAPFCHMPTTEKDWVRIERKQMQARRNGRGKQKSSWGKSKGERKPTPDTPEQIAAKQAERKAKREQKEREDAGM